jgi:hypothetical protein
MVSCKLGVLDPELVEAIQGTALMAQQLFNTIEQVAVRSVCAERAGGGGRLPLRNKRCKSLLSAFELAMDVSGGTRA